MFCNIFIGIVGQSSRLIYIYLPTCNIDSDKVEVLITSWNGFAKAEHDMAIFFDHGQIMKKVTTIPPIAGGKNPHNHI